MISIQNVEETKQRLRGKLAWYEVMGIKIPPCPRFDLVHANCFSFYYGCGHTIFIFTNLTNVEEAVGNGKRHVHEMMKDLDDVACIAMVDSEMGSVSIFGE